MPLRFIYAGALGFLLTVISFVITPKINAQSCGNYYATYTSYYNSCPSSKVACGYTCPNNTVTTAVSCKPSSNFTSSCVPSSNVMYGTACSMGSSYYISGSCYRNCTTVNTTTTDPDFENRLCNACPYSSWSDIAGCGQNGCGPTDKQQRRTSSAGGSACQTQYRCATNTTYCVAPSVPTVTASSCASPSNSSTAGWSAVSGATYYALRINKTSVGWNGQCSTPGNPNGGNFCENVGGTSYSFTGESGQSYGWWVHACNANNQCSAAVSSSFTCAAPPVNGSCGATNNACTAGTLSNTPDSPTQYLWNCVGSNGGSTASCSQNKPVNGACGAAVDTCTAGTYSDRADSPTQYLWSCLGLYGGTNASCSQDIPLPAYYKLKDTSFYKLSLISSEFPPSYSCPASRYDNSDTCTGGYFNQGEAGVVVSRGNTISAGASGGSAVSGSVGNTRNWTATNYQGGSSFNPTSYYNYVKARKNAVPASDLASIPASGTGGTYTLPSGNVTVSPSTTIAASYVTIIVNGDLTLSTNNLSRDGIVFIVDGNVTINGVGASGRFNNSNRPFALISTGEIAFANTLTEANGLYVGTSINFGTGAVPLKIVGNVTSTNPSPFNRDSVSSTPSMFIVFDPRHYLNIIDKVSTVKTSWTQLQ